MRAWADLARRIGERALAWQQGCFYWGDAIVYDGLLEVDDRLDAGWSGQLRDRLRRWYEVAPVSWDDALAPGAAAASLVRSGLLEPAVLQRIVEAITRLPQAAGVPLLRPQVPRWRTLVWVDSLYHLPPTLIAAGEVLQRPELIEHGVKIAGATVRLLRAEPALAHAYDTGLLAGTGVRWTRGIGWALLGLLDVVTLAPDAARAAHLDGEAARLIAALAAAQRQNGHWPTVLEEAAASDETSVAGFWIAAARHRSWTNSPTEYELITERALAALVAAIEPDGTVTGVSHDTHVTWSVSDYLRPATLPSPWGQGVALRALARVADADQ